jgi:GH25 family lysozyme M1 (1,4-beta-N-acetylmuramidase)
MGTCRGIDVSAYQGAQDWGAHKRNGVVFAMAKASEGQRSRDARFATHITGIKNSGLVPGAYHFGWPNQDPATEAANYIAAVRAHAGPGFLHWLDLERYSDGRNYRGRSDQQIHDWAARWIGLVADAFPGQHVGVYTSGDDIAKGHLPVGVPLWYPAYPGTSVDTYAEAEVRAQPKPSGRAPLIWQFTSDPASGPNLDLNICYLSAAELRTWAAGTTPTVPEEDDMQLNDAISLGSWVPKAWPKDTGLADGKIAVNTALGSGYAYSRIAAEGTRTLLAQVGALSAALAKLAEGGGLDAAQIQAAAEAGAQAALDRLSDALSEPATAAGGQD